ncbi:MAG: hypothetical protein ACYCYG_05310 [Bellilinea sp.]
MEPNYDNLDPQERVNRILALFSFLIGAASICGGLIPIIGAIGAVVGVVAGVFGRKSDSHKLATAGIIISSFALTLSLTYGFIVYLSTPK